MGRQRKPIDPEQVRRLASYGLEVAEIGAVLGMSRQGLHRRFQEQLDRGRASMKASLRRAQYRRAVKDRSDRMLIHLGRIYLDQRPSGGGGEQLDAILADLLERAGGDGDGDGGG